MLIVEKQPNQISFARNPICYRLRTVDANGQAYGGNGKIGRILFSTIDEKSLKFNEQVIISWTTGSENYSVTFTGHPTPSQTNQLLSQPHTLNAAEYAQDWANRFAAHPVISAFFEVEYISFLNTVGIKLEEKTMNPDFDLTFDFSDSDELDDSNYSYEDYAESNLPENYRIKIEVYFQNEYPSGSWNPVCEIEEYPNEDGLTEINIQDILKAQLDASLEVPQLPGINSNQKYIANNLRQFSIRYSEWHGTPQVEQTWEFSAGRRVMCGGIDQERFAYADFFSMLNEDNSLLTWTPDKRTIAPNQPEYLAWFNYSGSLRRIALEVTTYDAENNATVHVLNDDWIAVYSGHTVILPVGLNQLGFDDDNIRKYTVQVVRYQPPDIVFENNDRIYSQLRTFYLDCYHYECSQTLLYLDSFCLPQVVHLTGQTKKDLTINRSTSAATLGSTYSSLHREKIQHSVSWENIYTYRTGWKPRAEVDALQQLLIENQAYEIEENHYRPIHLTGKKFKITECLQFLHALEFQATRALSALNYSNDEIAAPGCCATGAVNFDGTMVSFDQNIIVTFPEMTDNCNTIPYYDLETIDSFNETDELIIVIGGIPRRITVGTLLDNLSTEDTNLANTDLELIANRIHKLEDFILSFDGNGKVIIGATDGQSKLTVAQGDIEAADAGKGLITKDEDDNRTRMRVNTDGIIVIETT